MFAKLKPISNESRDSAFFPCGKGYLIAILNGFGDWHSCYFDGMPTGGSIAVYGVVPDALGRVVEYGHM